MEVASLNGLNAGHAASVPGIFVREPCQSPINSPDSEDAETGKDAKPMSHTPFVVASDGVLLADDEAMLPSAHILSLYNGDALAPEAENQMPAGVEVVRYDIRETGFPATAMCKANTVFRALRDERRLALILHAMTACFGCRLFG